MSNVTNLQKRDISILILREMQATRENKIEAGISKVWLSNQMIIQQAIVDDYRAKDEADKAQ